MFEADWLAEELKDTLPHPRGSTKDFEDGRCARAFQACEPDHLAGTDGKVDRRQAWAAMPYRHRSRAQTAVSGFLSHLAAKLAHHRARDTGNIDLVGSPLTFHSSVAKHSYAVGERKDLVEPMGHE